jgi:dihydroflavonol-4-reductase
VSKVLVTGATGLLGANLVRELTHRGKDVRVLVRETSMSAAIDTLDVEAVWGDITDNASLDLAMKGVQEVYHAASQAAQWRRLQPLMHRVNVIGTRNVCAAALSAGVRRLVHVSTVDAVGVDPSGSVADESLTWNLGGLRAPYATTKYAAELVVQDHIAAGLDAVIVNPTTMFGPWDVKPTSGRMILAVAAGRTLGYPNGGDNFVDVRDVAAATIRAMEAGVCGRRYILGGENMSYGEVMKLIAEVVGSSPPRIKFHPGLTRAAGAISDLWGGLTGRQPSLSSVEAKFACMNAYYDSGRAHRELAMPTTPVREAVSAAWRWFVDHGYTGDFTGASA